MNVVDSSAWLEYFADKVVQNVMGDGNIFSGTGNVQVDKK